jgi:hypothetical protein
VSKKKQQGATAVETPPSCWCCEGKTDRPNVMRVVSRGDRKGDTVGPLCDDCEQFMERNVLVEDLPK